MKTTVRFAVLLGSVLVAGIAHAGSNDRNAPRSSAAPTTAPATTAWNTGRNTQWEQASLAQRADNAPSTTYATGANASRAQPPAVAPASGAIAAARQQFSPSPQRSLW